jgi:3-phytase
MKRASLSAVFLAFASTAWAQGVKPTAETAASRHPGDTADDSCVWIHPSDPSLSLVIADDKDGGIQVFTLDGAERQYLDGSKRMNNIDLRYNFPLAGKFANGDSHTRVALVGTGNETDSAIAFYKVNPATRRLEGAGSISGLGLVPYGSCMYRSPVSGKYYYFVNAKSGVTQQWELRDNGAGGVAGTKVRQFDVGSQPEGCVADDVLAKFYIGEEAVGIWKYGAEPGDGGARTQVDKTGSGGNLAADVEGMSIYYVSDGTGYLIVSSQGNSTFCVYTREGANSFIFKFSVGSNGTIDAVSGTDGLDVTNFPLGPAYPKGLFVCHDNANSGATSSNHKFVPWESVAAAAPTPLKIDTTWDPRKVGAPSTGLSTVTVAASDASAAEPGTNTGRFTVTRTGSTTASLTVSYTTGGTASAGTDYAALAGSVVIPAGQASANVAVTPLDDSTPEGAETVTVTLTAQSTYTVGSPSSATVTIADNDTSAGTGLKGEYYDNVHFTGPSVTRVDPLVDFDWGAGAPDPALAPDTFSVRWTGRVEALYGETYRFFTLTDDGARLWVDGELLVDHWSDQSATERSGSIALLAGRSYTLQMDYYENTGGAVARLFWASPSTPKQIVPSTQLQSSTSPPDPRDNDGDGIANDRDDDDDNDGVPDLQDSDRDGDGVANVVENAAGTDPDDRTSLPAAAADGGGGGGGCGATGFEILALGLFSRMLRRFRA